MAHLFYLTELQRLMTFCFHVSGKNYLNLLTYLLMQYIRVVRTVTVKHFNTPSLPHSTPPACSSAGSWESDWPTKENIANDN